MPWSRFLFEMVVFSQFLSEASFGLRVLSLPACIRVSVNHELVCAITRHKFELESPNLDQKMPNILLKVPLFWGLIGLDLPGQILLYWKICLFASLLHLWNICETCLSNCSTSHMAPHTLSDNCMPPTGSRNRLWNCLAVYLGETIGVSASLDSAIGTQFYKLLSVFSILYTPHMPKFYMPTCGNRRNNSKTAPISLYFVWLSMLGKPGTALFLAP